MSMWKQLAIASAIGMGMSLPAYAADGDALQSYESQEANKVERNPVVTPTPTWDSTHQSQISGYGTANQPNLGLQRDNTPPARSMYGAPSAASESHATGKVDADQAAPPRTGADVQPGDMGPSDAKAGGNQ